MAEDRVVFLALGGTRRRAAADEAGRVVARGGVATVVVADSSAWRNDRLADGVRLIDLKELELGHAWMPVEQAVLMRLPRRAARLVGRGPLRGWSKRALAAYRRRVADPLHHRAFVPLLRRGRGALPANLIRRRLRDTTVDLLVVNDPASMPAAVALLQTYDRGTSPRVAYGIDDLAPATSTPPAQHDRGQPQGDR
jgi:hypothetical protein